MNAPHNSTRNFEDRRWSESDQKVEFRHTAALSLIPGNASSMLDVGCGAGTFLKMVHESRPNVVVTGVDLSEVALRRAKEKVPDATVVCVDTASILPFEDDAFDVVTALDVLEHTLEPEAMLKEMRRVARHNVIVGVPNFSSLPARLQTLMGSVPENNRPHKGHVYWFNRHVLLDMMRKTQLTIEDERSNYQLEQKKIIGNIVQWAHRIFPQLLSLSFVVRASK